MGVAILEILLEKKIYYYYCNIITKIIFCRQGPEVMKLSFINSNWLPNHAEKSQFNPLSNNFQCLEMKAQLSACVSSGNFFILAATYQYINFNLGS